MQSRKQMLFWLTTFCFFSITTQLPLSVASLPRLKSAHIQGVRPKGIPNHVGGVWRITRLSSLLGPSVAIYLYGKLGDAYEKYEPMVSTMIMGSIKDQSLRNNKRFLREKTPSFSSSNEMSQNAYVLKVANEIIRITNRTFREKAIVSRIQMDDDQYELTKDLSVSEVRSIALQVMENVLESGSGRFLLLTEKDDVRKLVQKCI